jgi:hypothetical protein
VLEHALRHLAWLALDDPEVRAALTPAWLEALDVYKPEPFWAIGGEAALLPAAHVWLQSTRQAKAKPRFEQAGGHTSVNGAAHPS